eukprot:EG_transcript_25614
MALDEANAAGGVQGRNLTLVLLDDAHNYTRAAANARQLLAVHNATVLANIYGTDCLPCCPRASQTPINSRISATHEDPASIRQQPPPDFCTSRPKTSRLHEADAHRVGSGPPQPGVQSLDQPDESPLAHPALPSPVHPMLRLVAGVGGRVN